MLGAGSWGTALAIQFARAGHSAVLWARDRAQVEALAAARRNVRYLPDAPFPAQLEIASDLRAAVERAEITLVAVPSQGFRTLLEALRALPVTRLAWATKGFELDTGLLPYQVVGELFADGIATAVLSGPTFAREVGAGLPSAMTVASTNRAYAQQLAASISTDTFRAYTSDDVIGVEVGGATKNVYAIGAGICDGLGFGANTRIALIARGLAEMTRLGLALGARAQTFMGLAGMGDLVLTCTDDQSRNRRFGLALARGASVADALRAIGQVVEGYNGALAVHRVAERLGVAMPIVEQLYRVLHEHADPRAARHRAHAQAARPRARLTTFARSRTFARRALSIAHLRRGRQDTHPWGSAAHIPVRRRPRDARVVDREPRPAWLRAAGEAELAPGFEDGDRGGVRQIQAAVARAHRAGEGGARARRSRARRRAGRRSRGRRRTRRRRRSARRKPSAYRAS